MMAVAPVRAAAPIRTPIAPIRAVIAPGSTIIDLRADRTAGLPPTAAPITAPPDHRALRLDKHDRGRPRNDGDGRRDLGRRRRTLRGGGRCFRRIEIGSFRGVPE